MERSTYYVTGEWMSSLPDEALEFLLSSRKVTEKVSPQLRQAIAVVTGLESAVVAAIEAGRDIVVAGSAGTGKTNLIEAVRDAMPETTFVRWPEEEAPKKGPYVRVVLDLTGLEPEQRSEALEVRPRNCQAVILAVNEGILVELARSEPDSVFTRALSDLHLAQRGIHADPYRPDDPLVIDLGGFGPADNNVVARILALPVLDDVVQGIACKCEDDSVCPRKQAWAQVVESEEVRNRINDMVRMASNSSLSGEPAAFRSIWNFIADVVTGGSCDDAPPTSAWFWRVFYGASDISSDLQLVADPSHVVMPRVESHLYYGDLSAISSELVDDAELVDVPNDEDILSSHDYLWMKAQLFFLWKESSALDILADAADVRLQGAVREERVPPVLEAINRYMTYATVNPSLTHLDLWVDVGVERRLNKTRGQVSLGRVPNETLQIRRSLAAVNTPPESANVFGGRAYLVHDPSQATLLLSPESLSLLKGVRSYKSSDRRHADMDWQIARFFSRMATTASDPKRLEVLSIDFDAYTGQTRTYTQSRSAVLFQPSSIEA